jgi:cbb3-type cytochrome oxidase subunit 3
MYSLLTTPLLAENVNLVPTGKFQGLGSLTISQVISGLIKGTMVVAAIVFFFMLVIGGIKWIMSGGDKGKTEEARNQITAALIGLVVVFAAWAIVTLVANFFGITGGIFSLELPTATL